MERSDAERRRQVEALLDAALDLAAERRASVLEERQILASLEHPGIARLLDGGLTADGLPWFARGISAGMLVSRPWPTPSTLEGLAPPAVRRTRRARLTP